MPRRLVGATVDLRKRSTPKRKPDSDSRAADQFGGTEVQTLLCFSGERYVAEPVAMHHVRFVRDGLGAERGKPFFWDSECRPLLASPVRVFTDDLDGVVTRFFKSKAIRHVFPVPMINFPAWYVAGYRALARRATISLSLSGENVPLSGESIHRNPAMWS